MGCGPLAAAHLGLCLLLLLELLHMPSLSVVDGHLLAHGQSLVLGGALARALSPLLVPLTLPLDLLLSPRLNF